MPHVTLTAQGGALVANLEIPPFVTLPTVIVWGSRVFTHQENALSLEIMAPTHPPVYTEAFAYFVGESPPEGDG